MKTALVYDRINKFGGAERVLLALHEIWPDAPLFTAVHDPLNAPWANDFQIKTSFLQTIPFLRNKHELIPFLMPYAFESFNFDEYDLVISITSESAKGIITKPKTLHLCYCLTPTRYLWSGYFDYFSSLRFKSVKKFTASKLREWDYLAAQRPDVMVGISQTIVERIKKYYRRSAELIYPPVESHPSTRTKFGTGCPEPSSSAGLVHGQNCNPKVKSNEKFFLCVSRLVKYKKIDIAIEACNKLKLNLKIIGTGAEEQNLKKIAGPAVEFLGYLTDEELKRYYESCTALICPQEEDFGISALEAQSCGKPVIAYCGGGALETVRENITGVFFRSQTADGLAEELIKFDKNKYHPGECRNNARRFSKDKFKDNFYKLIQREWQKHRKNTVTR